MQSIPSSSTEEKGTGTIGQEGGGLMLPVIFSQAYANQIFLQLAEKKTLSEPLLHFPSGHKKACNMPKKLAPTHWKQAVEYGVCGRQFAGENKVVTFIKRVEDNI